VNDQLPPLYASNLPNGLSTGTLASAKPYIYVQTDVSQLNQFFATNQVGIAGFTFTWNNQSTPIYTSIMENVTLPVLGYTALSVSSLHETTNHEMAHSIDIYKGVFSNTPAYLQAVQDDLLYIRNAGGGHPCTVGTGYAQGPFVGIIDLQTQAQFCSNGALNNPSLYTENGTIIPNDAIAQVSSQNLDSGTILGKTGFVEPYAQSFAYQSYAFGSTYPGGYFDTTADGLFHQGFFQCAQSYAATLAGKVYTPTYSCN
jgi:hypothetical protein